MRVLCSPLGLGMQANASRAAMGRVDVLDFALGCPGVRACANSSKNTKNTGWLAPQSARPGRPLAAIIDAHA